MGPLGYGKVLNQFKLLRTTSTLAGYAQLEGPGLAVRWQVMHAEIKRVDLKYAP